MFESLRLTVLTPVATLLDVTGLRWIQVRLADGGGLGIFPGHAPLLAETVAAPLRYADAEGEHTLNVDAGILHITPSGVMLFTSGLQEENVVETSPSTDDIDHHHARLAAVVHASLTKATPWGTTLHQQGQKFSSAEAKN